MNDSCHKNQKQTKQSRNRFWIIIPNLEIKFVSEISNDLHCKDYKLVAKKGGTTKNAENKEEILMHFNFLLRLIPLHNFKSTNL